MQFKALVIAHRDILGAGPGYLQAYLSLLPELTDLAWSVLSDKIILSNAFSVGMLPEEQHSPRDPDGPDLGLP